MSVQTLSKWLKKWAPQSNDGDYVAQLWYGALTQPGQNDVGDYWSGAKHGAQNLCFGREACKQALKYYQKTGDLQGAKNIAAFYCIWHDCIHSGQYSAQEFKKTKILVQQLTSEFLLLLGASDVYGVGGCSFGPSTPVLLANGKTKPIGELKVGDKVESADPATGRDTGTRTIQHVWINHDTDLLDVAVSDGHGHTSVIHTTANHPFWDDTTHSWVRADRLKAGHTFASTLHQRPTVVATKTTPGAAYRWNLTVQQLHTYYVMAGNTPILVHNSCGDTSHAADCYCNWGEPVIPGSSAGDSGDPAGSAGGVADRDIHGQSQNSVRGVDVDHVWQNGEMYVQTGGNIVKVLGNGDGTYDIVVRDMGNPSGEPVTVMKDATQNYVNNQINSGRWQ